MLTSNSDYDELLAHIKENNAPLESLLPDGLVAVDLFEQVGQKKELDVFFDKPAAGEEQAVARSLARLFNFVAARIDEEAAMGKAQKKARKAADAVAKSQKKRKKQDEEPPPPPTMSLSESAAAKVLAQQKSEAGARERMLNRGYVLQASAPRETPTGQEHVKFMWANKAFCKELLGVEFIEASQQFGVKVKYDRAALEQLEVIKRIPSPNQKSAQRLKVSNYKLPLVGAPVSCMRDGAQAWARLTLARGCGPPPTHAPCAPFAGSDFWNVSLGHCYRQHGSADFKIVLNSTKEELEVAKETAVNAVKAKFTVKIDKLTNKIGKVCMRPPSNTHVRSPAAPNSPDAPTSAAPQADTAVAQAGGDPSRFGLKRQLESLRASRDGNVSARDDEVEAVEIKYDRMLTLRVEMTLNKASKAAKAQRELDSLSARAAPAGGATPADGAAALSRTTGGASEASSAEPQPDASAEPEASAEVAVGGGAEASLEAQVAAFTAAF